MGLDLDLISKETFLKGLVYELSVDDETKNLIVSLIQEGDHEKAIATLSLFAVEDDNQLIALYKHLYDPKQAVPDCEYLFDKYSFIMDDEQFIEESKVGSYSTLHYLRAFCDKICVAAREGSTIDEKFIRTLLRAFIEAGWEYEDTNCPALCWHLDCDGYYLPTVSPLYPFDLIYGSSFLLTQELDRIYSTGAIDILKNFKLEDDGEYAQSILWAFGILMHYALYSLYYGDILVFC